MFKRAMLTVIISALSLTLVLSNHVFAAEETTLNPTDDVSLTSRFPNQTSSANAILNINYNPENDGQFISFFNFDLAEIPALAKVDSADLVLARIPDADDTDVPFTAMLITEDWTQQTVTWLTRPDTAGNRFPTASEDFMLGGRGYTRFNLTKVVQEWIKNKDTTFGFQIDGPKNMEYIKKFHSSRGDVTPRLVIEYTVQTSMIQKEIYLPSDETLDVMEESEAETADIMEETAMEPEGEEGSDESIPEDDIDISVLENNIAQVLTPTNIKIAAGAIFLLILVKILLTKRS